MRSFTQQITPLLPLFYSKTGGARADLIHPLCICWHLEESLANLFSAGSSVSEKVFNHCLLRSELALNIPRGHCWKEAIIGRVIKQTKLCKVSIADDTFGQCSLYLHLSQQELTFQLSSLSDHNQTQVSQCHAHV